MDSGFLELNSGFRKQTFPGFRNPIDIRGGDRYPREGGGEVTWINFSWVCATGLSEPLPD